MSLKWADFNNSQQDIKLQFSGSNIQIIKDKTGAFVYVDKENVSAQYAGRCIIRGNSVQVLAAEKRVHELLARRDMMLMDNGGQKTGKKSGPNEKHDSSPDSSQVHPRKCVGFVFINQFRISWTNQKSVFGMGVKPGPVRKKLIANKNEMRRKEFKILF